MADIYSVYDAKARFSEVIRKVREGRTVLVSYHGETVAEIRPVGSQGTDLERRLQVLEGLGVISETQERRGRLQPIEPRPGGLQRFLEDRNG
jgi:prevent-host-death family protein